MLKIVHRTSVKMRCSKKVPNVAFQQAIAADIGVRIYHPTQKIWHSADGVVAGVSPNMTILHPSDDDYVALHKNACNPSPPLILCSAT
jgi:hypothetical protein